jgi:hypothetical protein
VAESKIDKEQRERLHRLVASIYVDGFSEGMSQLANEYGLHGLIPDAGATMPSQLKERISLVDKAVDSYVTILEHKVEALRASGLTGQQLYAGALHEAEHLAQSKAEVIVSVEHASARLDGAGAVLDESGMPHEWRFPHFDLGSDHDECPICEEIRQGAPYTQAQAEERGFPDYPHPHCDHGWVLVPKGEPTKTEEYPPVPTAPRYGR